MLLKYAWGKEIRDLLLLLKKGNTSVVILRLECGNARHCTALEKGNTCHFTAGSKKNTWRTVLKVSKFELL